MIFEPAVDNRYTSNSAPSTVATEYGVFFRSAPVHIEAMWFGTDELLARMEQKGVRNVDIARALDLPSSRVPGIRRKERALKLDEAVKLVKEFELDGEGQSVGHLSEQVVTEVARMLAGIALGSEPEQETVAIVSQALREMLETFAAYPEAASDVRVALPAIGLASRRSGPARN